MESRKTRGLSTFEKDELLRFFLHYMKADQRQMLMARYPVSYAILFPTVDIDVINIRTRDAIESLPAEDLVYRNGPNI